MLIRKNTKAFKTILEIVSACRDRPDREQLIRLYVTKAGDTIKDRISVEGIEGGAGVFYDMGYQAVLGNLKSANHQLYQSDDTPGLYFFHSSSNKVWDETPFEFDEAIKKEFASLPELPAVRKKEKAEKFVFPAPKVKAEGKTEKTESRTEKKEKEEPKPRKKAASQKENGEEKKSARVVALWPKQPDYKLKQDIHFTGLERIVVRQAQLTKKNILDYYDKISEYLLPYLQDRPQVIHLYRDGQRGPAISTVADLKKNSPEDVPEWLQTKAIGNGKAQEELLLCNDREHLLFYVQIGCLAFHAGHVRIRSLESPDFLLLAIESPDYELAKAVDVAMAANEIFTGLQLPSFVKTDGASGLHIYIPLDSKSDFQSCTNAAEYLCKLIRLKIPGLVAIKGSEDHGYGRVSLDYQLNDAGYAAIAPYSLVINQSANVATPVGWDEVTEELSAEAFSPEAIFKRLKEKGDPFTTLFKKKVNASTLLKRLEENYSFLL